MAKYEHKDFTFSLFKNEYKKDGDNHPDYKGRGKVAGVDYDFAIWDRGNGRFSGSVSSPFERTQPDTKEHKPKIDNPNNDPLQDDTNDLPF